MSTEDVKRAGGAGADGSKRSSTGFLNQQRRGLPYSPYTMAALAGLAVVGLGSIWYFTIYTNKKPQPTSSARVSNSQDMRPPK
ncbi:hypothetical protein ACJIZ3_001833 [Penstemon smallii]|uniref:Transmembrane protein n=1 Tax=Penstemon smallii TaxID=265156 RepID=A0ABD3U528_9LAMI